MESNYNLNTSESNPSDLNTSKSPDLDPFSVISILREAATEKERKRYAIAVAAATYKRWTTYIPAVPGAVIGSWVHLAMITTQTELLSAFLNTTNPNALRPLVEYQFRILTEYASFQIGLAAISALLVVLPNIKLTYDYLKAKLQQ